MTETINLIMLVLSLIRNEPRVKKHSCLLPVLGFSFQRVIMKHLMKLSLLLVTLVPGEEDRASALDQKRLENSKYSLTTIPAPLS